MDQTTTKRDPPQGAEDLRGPLDRRQQFAKEGPTTAKLFMHGRSQAVRLPKEFRFPGKEVRIHREGDRVILEPMKFDVQAWFKRLDRYRDVPFMPDGREQPEMPPDRNIFDE